MTTGKTIALTSKNKTIYASKVMAGAAIDLLEDPALLQAAKEEYRRTHPEGYVCPIPEGVMPHSVD